jgi:pre-mRNA-processing factor 8
MRQPGESSESSRVIKLTYRPLPHLGAQHLLPEPVLQDKTKKWRLVNAKRFSERRKHGYVESQKELLPPEVLRKIIKDHGDMSSKRFR